MKTALLLCVVLLASACGRAACSPRTVTATGVLATDIVGSWDFTIGGLRAGGDNWVYAFHADGGVFVYHSPEDEAFGGPIGGPPEPYVLGDGGYTLGILFHTATVSGNALVVDGVSEPAVTCSGADFN